MFVTWCLIIGLLLLVVGLTDTLRQPLPIGTSALYLGAGYLLGPEVYNLLHLNLADDAVLLERLAEGAVLISLFAVGLRLRSAFRDPIWRAQHREDLLRGHPRRNRARLRGMPNARKKAHQQKENCCVNFSFHN